MPFTVSHAAVALIAPPRARALLVTSALVAGTMAPDFPYFVDDLWPAALTHSWVGAVTVDAVMALVAVALWRWAMRVPLLSLLLQPWRGAALAQTASLRRGRSTAITAGALYVSAALGSLTHVFIDLFTHERANTPSVVAGRMVGRFELSWLLQMSLSAVGLAALTWWAARWWNSVPRADSSPVVWPRRALAVAGATLATALAVAFLRVAEVWGDGMRTMVVQWVFGACLGAAVALIAWCLAWHVRSAARAEFR